VVRAADFEEDCGADLCLGRAAEDAEMGEVAPAVYSADLVFVVVEVILDGVDLPAVPEGVREGLGETAVIGVIGKV